MNTIEQGDDLANELLEGAGQIAKFMYGRDDQRTRRRVFYLLETGEIPGRKMGGKWISKKTAIRERTHVSGRAA
jgi:hypothetical protein